MCSTLAEFQRIMDVIQEGRGDRNQMHQHLNGGE